jgi:hypothetical protein
MKARLFILSAAVLIALTAMSPIPNRIFAQQGSQPQPQPGQFQDPGRKGGNNGTGDHSVTFAGPPAGTQALPIDLFSSKNFYKDEKNWSDQLYFRCNTPRQLSDMWTSERIGRTPPTSAAWGDCSMDYPRAKIVSPYPYKTAKEHYQALLAAAKAKGGPTVYTKATLPDWDGWYARDMQADGQAKWFWGTTTQVPTILSLLTPEYQKRFVQMNYHEVVDNAPQWNAMFCYPEGLMRWWGGTSSAGDFQLTMNPWNVQFLSGEADNFLRQVLVGQERHVQQVPQWYGESIGFWDGATLVTWTGNVQAWWTHTMFEYSDKMESVETFKPVYDANGKFVGLDHEAVFYDPVALVQPVHITYRFVRRSPLNDATRRYTYVECLSNIRDVNGRPIQLTDGQSGYVDYYGRPWALDWEKYFEVGWDKPPDSSLPEGVLGLFKNKNK